MIYAIISVILILLLLSALYVIYNTYKGVFTMDGKKAPDMSYAHSSEQYNAIKAEKKKSIDEFEREPYEELSITSFDGYALKGRFYEVKDSKKAVLIFHGYKSNVASDSSRIMNYCRERGFSVLSVHQRAHKVSEGRCITFGINERLDCKSWVDYITKRLGSNARLVLCGVSMGGATVMMASDLEMPNVCAIFSDCGFSSPEAILRIVVKNLGYPEGPAYALLKLGALIFGRFNVEKTTAIKALSNSSIPLTIVHSDGDKYVPCKMAYECFESAKTENKKLYIIEKAGHALSYYFDKEKYLSALDNALKYAE